MLEIKHLGTVLLLATSSKVRPKGSPLQIKRIGGMWKLVSKNPVEKV